MTNKPNIVFYVSDSLRADHLSCYGYERETTPNIDQLADDGIRLENLFSQAYKTVESSVSILTGLYPPAHGARTTYDVIPEEAPRIATKLREAGYATAGFSTLVQISERRGFDEGFDTFEELFRTQKAETGVTDWAGICTDRSIEWLDERVKEPFFLFLWSNGTHDPYNPRAGVFTEESPDHDVDGSLGSLRSARPEQASIVRDLYDDTVRHADGEFGRLVEYLKRKGLYEDTVIVFTADHGELLSEHGRLEHTYGPIQSVMNRLAPGFVRSKTLFEPGAFVGHLAALPYDELIHVPGIVKPAGGTHDGETRSGLVETVDLMSTVADVVGVRFETQGESLRPLFDEDKPFKQYVYSDTAISRGLTQSRSVRSKTHKLVRTDWELSRLRSRKMLDLENILYSTFEKTLAWSTFLFEVPDEDRNVSSQAWDVRDGLVVELEEWLRDNQSLSLDTRTSKLDAETEQQLRELGYMK